MKVTSFRRRLIVLVLLVLAIVGAVLRLWAPNPSLARDVGTLLLVMWLPVLGNIISFAIARVARLRRRHAFETDAPFHPHLVVELAATEGRLRVKREERRCTLVIGSEGFTARLGMPVAQWLGGAQPKTLPLELLRPELALPRLGPGAEFDVFAGASLVGRGRVVEPVTR